MTKLFGPFISLEMVALWALESFLSAFVIYSLLALPEVRPTAWPGVQFQAAHHAAAFALTIGVTSVALGLYRSDTCLHMRRLIVSTLASGIIAFPALLLVGHLFRLDPDFLVGPDPLWPCKILISWLACLLATRLAFTVAMRNNLLTRRVVVIGSDDRIGAVRDAIRGIRRGFFQIAGSLSERDAADELHPETLRRRGVWGVVMSSGARASLSGETLARCEAHGVRVLDDVEFRERQLGRVDLASIAPDWLAGAKALRSSAVERGVRRLGDIFIASVFLVGTAPLMALTALLIRLDSPGGVLYRQERVGLHGRNFTLLKFRSMRVDAEAGSGPSWAARRDPRITRIGSFMRRSRIDELPQILNVLRGEMSFIGPRPERPHFVAQLAEAIPHYRDRAHVKPGLTGWAQVNFPYGASIEDARMKLAFDLYYIRHRSLLLDVMILLSTVRVILFQEGAR